MASAARRVALNVLVRVFEEGAYADRAFAGEAAGLEERDRAFAQRLAYGATQRVRTLDYALEEVGGRSVAELDIPVRAALRLGAYELAFMDAVPARATVNEAVELARATGASRATGLVNAVLRKATGIAKLIDDLPEGTPQEAALKHSYPDWIAETWWREWGADEALAFMRAQNEPPERVVRPAGTGTWPQSRGSQLAGRSVGVEPGERAERVW